MSGEVCVTIGNELIFTQAPDSYLDQLRERLTMPNPKHAEAVKRGYPAFGIPKFLKLYREAPFRAPRGFGIEAHVLAVNSGLTVKYDDQRRRLPDVSLTFRGNLRPYQQEAVSAVLARQQGVLEAGTGAGKTVMALAVIAGRRQPALILVHTKELVGQWKERLNTFLGIEAGTVGGGKFDLKPVTVATVQTAKKHLKKLVPHFGHLIVDECHRTPSATFSETVRAFDCRFLLGLTATPFRRDGLTRLIHLALGDLAHRVNPARLREIGAILRPEIVTRETTFTFWGNAAEKYAKCITALIEDEDRNRLIAGDVLREAQNGAGACLIVSDRTRHLEALAAVLEAQGQPVAILTGKTPGKRRVEIVEDLKAGKVRVLASTTSLIGEGFDAPGLAVLFLASPVKFSGRLIQIVGRILRPKDGKQPRLYDYQDNCVGVLKASARARAKTYRELAA